jgi:hypothetical protein
VIGISWCNALKRDLPTAAACKGCSRPAVQGPAGIRLNATSRNSTRSGQLVDAAWVPLAPELASDRTSCHSAMVNQVRLVLHTAAFWLMHTVQSAIPDRLPADRGGLFANGLFVVSKRRNRKRFSSQPSGPACLARSYRVSAGLAFAVRSVARQASRALRAMSAPGQGLPSYPTSSCFEFSSAAPSLPALRLIDRRTYAQCQERSFAAVIAPRADDPPWRGSDYLHKAHCVNS